MLKLCVFDLDGTLVDTMGDISEAMNRSLVALGYKPHPKEEYYQMVGDGMVKLCQRAIPDASEEEVLKLIDLYASDYIKNCCVNSVCYDGILNVVKKLKEAGIICAILSNKPHNQTMEISEKLFPNGLFDTVLGKTEDFPPKPAPDSLIYVMNKYNAKPEEVVYIGDSNVDILLGKKVGVLSVGVAWGFRGEEELKNEKADFIAYKAEDLLDIILTLN